MRCPDRHADQHDADRAQQEHDAHRQARPDSGQHHRKEERDELRNDRHVAVPARQQILAKAQERRAPVDRRPGLRQGSSVGGAHPSWVGGSATDLYGNRTHGVRIPGSSPIRVLVRGRLTGRRLTGGQAHLSVGPCTGSLTFTAAHA